MTQISPVCAGFQFVVRSSSCTETCMPVRSKPQVPGRRSSSPAIVFARRQYGDVAGHLGQAVVLHQHAAQLLQRQLLVLPVHGRAGVDDKAQAGVVMPVHTAVLHQHLQDGRNGEQVGQAVLLDEREGRAPDRTCPTASTPSCRRGRSCSAGEPRRRATAAPARASHLPRSPRHQVAQMIGDHEAPFAHGSARPLSDAPWFPR